VVGGGDKTVTLQLGKYRCGPFLSLRTFEPPSVIHFSSKTMPKFTPRSSRFHSSNAMVSVSNITHRTPLTLIQSSMLGFYLTDYSEPSILTLAITLGARRR